MEYKPTQDQQTIFDIVEGTSKNILIHGKPGVGKTVLVHYLRECGIKHYTIAAPTGLAAINAAGSGTAKTLHSLFGIPVSEGIFTHDFNKFTQNDNIRRHVLYGVKHLIIDEISMVRVDVLDYIDRMLREVKGINEPFGGIQVIAVGDFFQLPPVVNSSDKKALRAEGYKSEFAFDSKVFTSFMPLVLTEVLRQKGDDKFIDILHAARTGTVSPPQLKALNKRVEKCTDLRIKLAAKNKQAEAINAAHLTELTTGLKEYHANSYGVWPQFPAETVLSLKVGAQVLIKKNGADIPPRVNGKRPESQVVNGSLGVIVEMNDGYIKVKLRNEQTVSIFIQRWEQSIKERVGDQWTERVVASFEQLPVQLAWAISMHKSQGQSFEFVHVNPSSVFAEGQLYVALSRARSMAGLSLQHPVSADHFMVNEDVLRYVKQIEVQSKENKKQAA